MYDMSNIVNYFVMDPFLYLFVFKCDVRSQSFRQELIILLKKPTPNSNTNAKLQFNILKDDFILHRNNR